MYRDIDADYYGYRDDEDGVLVRLEAEAERRGTNSDNDPLNHSIAQSMDDGFVQRSKKQ